MYLNNISLSIILGSVPSLAAGLVFGGALTYGAYQMSGQPPNYVPQLVTSSILAGVMGYRFYNSGKIMPAGMVCILSVAIIAKIALGTAGVLPGRKYWRDWTNFGSLPHNFSTSERFPAVHSIWIRIITFLKHVKFALIEQFL